MKETKCQESSKSLGQVPGQTDTNEEKRRGQNPEENTKEEKAEKKRLDPGAAQPSYGRQIRDQNPDTGRNQGSE